MSTENKALIRRWFEEVWNQGRASAIDEILAGTNFDQLGMLQQLGVVNLPAAV